MDKLYFKSHRCATKSLPILLDSNQLFSLALKFRIKIINSCESLDFRFKKLGIVQSFSETMRKAPKLEFNEVLGVKGHEATLARQKELLTAKQGNSFSSNAHFSLA